MLQASSNLLQYIFIGHVVPSNSIYIASEDDGSLLPLGMPGEICIADAMVANGYLNPSLNEGVFIKNQFATAQNVEQGFRTVYKTGDRGMVHEDGSIIFLGRTQRGSTVIKLRGLRIGNLGGSAGRLGRRRCDSSRRAAVPRVPRRFQTVETPGASAAHGPSTITSPDTVHDPSYHYSVGTSATCAEPKVRP